MAARHHFPRPSCSKLLYTHSAPILTLLQHADNAQQAFSSDQASTLHLAIPALEALHKAWSSRALRVKYERFVPALEVACKKIDKYYEKTTDSPAYIIAMSKWYSSHQQHYWFDLSPQPEDEDVLFQEKLADGFTRSSCEMCWRSGT